MLHNITDLALLRSDKGVLGARICEYTGRCTIQHSHKRQAAGEMEQ